MTNAAQKLIDSFEALPETDQHEVLAQLLHRLIDSPYASPSDEDFTQAADLIFQEFNRHEEQGVRSPRRGEVWLVDLGLAAKIRPCLVLSIPTAEVDRSLVTVVPHTTSLRETRFEVTVSVPFLRTGGFDAQGIVTVPTVRLIRHLGTLKLEQFNTVVRGVCLWLGINAGS